MRPHEIENWALGVVERVVAKQPVEDFRVELKSTWPEPDKAARRIAGHANAAGGAQILWLVGVDENNGVVVGARQEEFAAWFGQVGACFNELPPQVTQLAIPAHGQTIVALLFNTDRAPFVVKNPQFGNQAGGPVELEVPYREATSTRSARRSDLIRLLSPRASLPDLEVLTGELSASPSAGSATWHLNMKVYVYPKGATSVVIPFHRCEGNLQVPGCVATASFRALRFQAPALPSAAPLRPVTASITSTDTEVVVDGPGHLHVLADAETELPPNCLQTDALVSIRFLPVGLDVYGVLDTRLSFRPKTSPDDLAIGRWRVGEDQRVPSRLVGSVMA